MNKFNYRSEIDGLRAIAVLSVIFYHSKIKFFEKNFFSGGYIGVDIFFVISGYLICLIIFSEIKSNERFNFFNFFERRIRRILPALFFIIFISLPFAYYILSPTYLLDYAKSTLASIFFFSNFYFIVEDYNSPASIFKPLLHTWSLSVEGQFYLFFPFFIIFIFKFFKKNFIEIILTILILSLISSHIYSSYNPSKNFYILTSRIWEFFLGAIIAIIHVSKNYLLRTRFLKNKFLPFIGIILLLFSIFFFNEQIPHPSFYTLIPLSGVALVIFCRGDNFINKILSHKILSSIGVISYSMYLWHYIIFSLGAHANLYHDKVSKKAILLTILLSIVTYFFIEKPFRNKKIISFKKLILFLLILLSIIVIFFFFIFYKSQRFSEKEKILNSFLKNQIPQELFKDKVSCFASNDFCHFKNINNKKTVFIVGDSLMEGLSSSLKDEILKLGLNVIVMNNSGCYFSPDFNSVIGDRQRVASNQICDFKYQNKRLKKILDFPESIIVFGGILDPESFKHHKYKNIDFYQNYKKNILELLSNNYKIIQITDNIIYKKNISELIRKKLFDENIIQNNDIKFDFFINIGINEFKKINQKNLNFFNEINHQNYHKISIFELFCNNQLKDKCSFNDEKDLFIHDTLHFTKKGSHMVNSSIIGKIIEIKNK
jgi:peptidoglycan/LPS O-acetylase OafA/YrhL